MKKYSTILFDADDTLLDFSKDEAQALEKTLLAVGITPAKEITDKYKSMNVALWKALERGEITKQQLKETRFRNFFEAIGFCYEGDCFAVNEMYLQNLAEGGNLLPGVRELIGELKEKGYDLYIVTNGIAATQRKRLEKSGILPFFTDIFVSETIGFQKPRKEYFDYVLSHIKETDKSKVLLVGDSLTSDIKGSENAGIDCVWLRHDKNCDCTGYSITKIISSPTEILKYLQ